MAKSQPWSEIEEDHPIPLLHRKLVKGENALVARVRLETGCQVPLHQHASEQIAVVVSGKLLWNVGGEELIAQGGEVLVLPPNVPHSVTALEDSEVFDILSPVGPMGVDMAGAAREEG